MVILQLQSGLVCGQATSESPEIRYVSRERCWPQGSLPSAPLITAAWFSTSCLVVCLSVHVRGLLWFTSKNVIVSRTLVIHTQMSCPSHVLETKQSLFIAHSFLLPPFSPASLHPHCTRWLRVHQPTCGEHCVWVCGNPTCPAAAFQSGLASGVQLFSGGGPASHQRGCHLWARTELRGQLSGCLPTLWVVNLFSDCTGVFCFNLCSTRCPR